jgi:hypothetical protein
MTPSAKNTKSLGGVRQSLSGCRKTNHFGPSEKEFSLFVRSNLFRVCAAQKMLLLHGSYRLLPFSQGSISSVCRSAKPKFACPPVLREQERFRHHNIFVGVAMGLAAASSTVIFAQKAAASPGDEAAPQRP